MPESCLLSVVLLSYYSGSRIARAYERLSARLDREGISFELVVTDEKHRLPLRPVGHNAVCWYSGVPCDSSCQAVLLVW